jgi:hypothetical protein
MVLQQTEFVGSTSAVSRGIDTGVNGGNGHKKCHCADDVEANKCPNGLRENIKILLAVAFVIIPVIFFWALYEQQGTTFCWCF